MKSGNSRASQIWHERIADVSVASYQELSDEHKLRLASAYTDIGLVYQEAGMMSLSKIAALQAAWFRCEATGGVEPGRKVEHLKTGVV